MKIRASIVLGLFVAIGSLRTASQERPADVFYTAIRANDLAAVADLVKRSDVNVKDERGLTPLMYAAWVGSIDAMKLVVAAGANLNAVNNSGSTALMFAVTQPEKVRLLLDGGARVDAATGRGRTALLIAAMSDRSAPVVRMLLDAGADPKAADALKTTALNAAAQGNDTETIRLFIDAGVDVNAGNGVGLTPVIFASSNNNVAAVRLLLQKGANVRAVTADYFNKVKAGPVGIGRLTALHTAAPRGSEGLLAMLLDAGADVNAQDIRGMTPLMLAVGTDHANPGSVKLLLRRGASTTARNLEGETAIDIARKFGNDAIIALVHGAGSPAADASVAPVPPAPADLKTAIDRSISLLEKTTTSAASAGGCASCHAHNVTDMVSKVARRAGFAVDQQSQAARRLLTRAEYAIPMNMLERHDAPGSPDVPINALWALANSGYQADRITDGMVANIAARQLSDGTWVTGFGAVARAPMSDGNISRTALAVLGLKAYAAPGMAPAIDERIARARNWLEHVRPETSDDRAMQLIGLHAAGADPRTLRKLARAVIERQMPDGGWAQLSHLKSDAYATGQTLYALAETGMLPPTDAAYQKGVRFLLKEQRADGSWHVRSRAVKFQPYFESGFPYGHDQWISSMATGWASAALMLSVPQSVAGR